MFTKVQSIEGSMGGGHTPVEAPDSGVSQQKAQLLIVLSEGQIKGFTDVYNQVYLNKVKASEYNSSVTLEETKGTADQAVIKGFEKVNAPHDLPSLELRAGTVTIDNVKEPMVEAKLSIAAGIDAVSLLFTINSLYQVEGNGDTNGSEVSITLQVYADSGYSSTPVGSPKVITIKEKISSPYGFSTEIVRPVGLAIYPAKDNEVPWYIKVTKDTPDSDSSKKGNSIFFTQAINITYSKLAYPYKALLGATARDAKQFGGKIPEILAKPFGIEVFLPGNYNPEDKSYNTTPNYQPDPPSGRYFTDALGAWNGNFANTLQYTNNPAWCLFHVLTDNDVFAADGTTKVKESIGLKMSKPIPVNDQVSPRTYLTPDDVMGIDIFAFYELGKYCDEQLSNGNYRYTIDYQFIQRENVTTFLNYFLNLMEARFKRNEFGQLSLFWDRRGQEVARLVTNQNVENGLFTYSASNLEQRFTVVNVTYNDETAYGESNTVTVTTTEADAVKLSKDGTPLWKDGNVYKQLKWNGSIIEQTSVVDTPFDLVARYGLNSTDIVLLGAVTEERAIRKGRAVLYNSCFLYDIVGFKVLLAGMNYQLGDLIAIADNNVMRNNAIRSGKFTEVSRATLSVTVTFDRPVELTNAITYELSYTCVDGVTIATTTVTGSSTVTEYTFNIASADKEPLLSSVWVLKKTTVEPELFKVVSIQLDTESGAYVISCMRHLERKYDYIDAGYTTNEQKNDFKNLQDLPIPQVTDLAFKSSYSFINGVIKPNLFVHWTYPLWSIDYVDLGRTVTATANSTSITFGTGTSTHSLPAGAEIRAEVTESVGTYTKTSKVLIGRLASAITFVNGSPLTTNLQDIAQVSRVTLPAYRLKEGVLTRVDGDDFSIDYRTIKFDVTIRHNEETPKVYTTTSPSFTIEDVDRTEDTYDNLTGLGYKNRYYVTVTAFDAVSGKRSAPSPTEEWTFPTQSSLLDAPTALRIDGAAVTSSRKDSWLVSWTEPTFDPDKALLFNITNVKLVGYKVTLTWTVPTLGTVTKVINTVEPNFTYNRELVKTAGAIDPTTKYLIREVTVQINSLDSAGNLSENALSAVLTKTDAEDPSYLPSKDTGSGMNISITYKANQGITQYKVHAKTTAWSGNPTDDTKLVKTIQVADGIKNNEVINSIAPYPTGHTSGGNVFIKIEAVDGYL